MQPSGPSKECLSELGASSQLLFQGNQITLISRPENLQIIDTASVVPKFSICMSREQLTFAELLKIRNYLKDWLLIANFDFDFDLSIAIAWCRYLHWCAEGHICGRVNSHLLPILHLDGGRATCPSRMGYK